MRRLTVAALLVCGSVWVQAQSPEALEWGPPVAGVQLRLAIAPHLATPQVPVFEVQLRNQSGNALTYVAEALNSQAEIEIDGVWYGIASAGSCCTAPQTVRPGSQSNVLPFPLQNRIMFKLDANGARINSRLWTLMPGKHTIRLRTRSAGRIGITVQGASAQSIVLVSNVVTFDMLSAQAVAGAPIAPDLAARALDSAKACIAKSPAAFRSVWQSPLNLDKAAVSRGTGPDLVNVFIPETAPQGKPQGLALEVNMKSSACVSFTDRLE